MREVADLAALGALPVHGGGRRRAAPRAPLLAPEEALLEVVRRLRGRARARRPRARARARRPRRLAVPDARVRRRVARLVRAAPLVLHGRRRERDYLVEAKCYPVLPLALLAFLAALAF